VCPHHSRMGAVSQVCDRTCALLGLLLITQLGILMALRLFQASHSSSSSQQLRLLTAYEDGSVALRATDRKTSVEGVGWDKLWTAKLHVESGRFVPISLCIYSHNPRTVMAMAVTLDGTLALSVSADHIIGRYNLAVRPIYPGGSKRD
jgi:hypothetical protein